MRESAQRRLATLASGIRSGPRFGGLLVAATLAAGVAPAEAADLKLVQRGSLTLGAGSSSTTATLSAAVDTTQAFLVFGIAGSDNSPDDMQVSGQITDATTLTFARVGTSVAVEVLWYVAEFTSGVSVQRGGAVIPDTIPADTDVALTAVDLTKSFPLISHRNSGVAFDASDFVRARIVENGVNDGGTPCATATTQCLRLYVPDGDATKVVEWQVVEYQDAVVQTGDLTFTDTDLTLTDAITSVDTTKSWLSFNYTCVSPTLCSTDVSNIASKMFRGLIQDATTLEFSRLGTQPSGDSVELTWYLVEFTDGTRVLEGQENLFPGELDGPDALSPAVEPATSIALGGGYMRGGRTDYSTDDDPGTGWFTFDITSATEVVSARGTVNSTASVEWFVIDFAGTPTSGHHLVYSTDDSFPDTPRVRTLETIAPTWLPEASTVAASTNVDWIVSEQAPTRDEEIAVVLSDAPQIDVQRWDGSAWSAEWSSTAGLVASNATRRGIAVAYEQTSGDAMVVYTNNSANPRYRTWDGSTWSAAANVFTTAPGTGEVRWVELASDPTTDRIALAYSDGQQDVHAAIWNGTAWDQTTKQTLTTAGANAWDYRDVDLAYEASGDLMVVHLQTGASDDSFHWWTMAAGTTTWVDGGDVLQVGGMLAHVEVAAEPESDRIAVVTIDENNGTERLGAATWTGAAWVDNGEYMTNVPHWEIDGPGTFWAAVEWKGTAGEAVIVFSDRTAGQMGWVTWDALGGWVRQADQNVPGMAGNIRSMQLEVVPGFDRVIAAFSDDAGDLRTAGYGTAGWTFGEVLNGGLTSADYKPFALSMSLLSVTAVELLSLDAVGVDAAVELQWATASEVDNLGFHVYRGASASGPWQRVTAALIPGLGSSAEGALYGYRDTGLENGTEYFYLLEDVESTGRTERHGPVRATPEAGGGASPDPDPDPRPHVEPEPEDVTGAWLAYGNPGANALRVLRRGPFGASLELETHGFYALPRADGTVRLWVPGFEELHDPGAPRIPVRRTWLEAVAGREVKLRGVRVRDVESFSGLRPVEAGEPVLATLGDGTQRLAERPARTFRRGDALHPERPARLLDVGFLGEQKRAWIELAPLRWDAVGRQLLLAKRIELRVVFAGRVPGEVSLGGSRGRRAPPHSSTDSRVVARLATREAGLHVVSFEDAFPGGHRPVRASSLGLSRQGVPVAYHLEPRQRRFGPGGRLYFLSEGGAAATHGNEAVYELSLGEAGIAMETGSAAPRGGALSHGRVTRRFEEQRFYQNGQVSAPLEDLWFWDIAIAPRVKAFDFELDAVTVGAPARLHVELQGATDAQRARVRLNGRPVGEAAWRGREARALEAVLPAGLLVEGTNRLELEAVPVPGARVSAAWLDGFTVEYPRRLEATAGRLEARFEGAGTAAASGLGAGSLLLDTSGDAPVWLEGAEWAPGSLRYGVGAGQRVLATSPESVLRPEVRPARATALRAGGGGADYVAIGPRAFLEAAEPLLRHRRDQGLRVAAVAVEDVYDAFGHGEPGPGALRELLSWAYHEWPQPAPRYVLLLGDTTYDVKDYLGAPAADHVPAWMLRTSALWTLSDPAYGAVNGEDLLPDMAVGRLPASDAEQARALAEKTVAFERGGWSFSEGPVVLVADDPDRGGDFEADVEAIARGLEGREVEKLLVSELGGATRPSIRAAFDRGAALMSYLGHGGTAVWASENVWNSLDPWTLAAQPRQPLVLAVNCLNGYIVHPRADALGEALVKPEGRGAIASFTASALSLNAAARVLHDALLEEALEGAHPRLGDALLAAQRAFADAGGTPETLGTYLLLGDPALSLR